jgi:hypothetical protein
MGWQKISAIYHPIKKHDFNGIKLLIDNKVNINNLLFINITRNNLLFINITRNNLLFINVK